MSSFDELLTRMEQRLQTYGGTGDTEIVLSDSALADADALWQAAQAIDPDHLAPGDNMPLPAARHAIGWLHFLRYNALPDGTDLPELARAIVYLTPLAHDHLEAIPEPLRVVLGATADPPRQAAIATKMLIESETTTDPVLLQASVSLLLASLDTTPHDHSHRAERLSVLGSAYLRRFERGGVAADLDRAIEASEQVVAAIPADHPERPMFLSNLGSAYLARFERRGVAEDLDRAIKAGEQALAAIPADHTERPMFLSNLNVAYQARFKRSGVAEDLDRAIEAGEQALAAVPADDPDRARRLSNLGNAYQARFERGGVAPDLDRAIVVLEQAVDTTPPDHPDNAAFLSGLGGTYLARFGRGGVAPDLDRAIVVLEQAVDTTPADHTERARHLSNLGGAYLRRFERGGVATDLDRAIVVLDQAVHATPADQINWAGRLSNLGNAYLARFERGGVAADLNQAIVVLEQAVNATPADRPDRAGLLSSLGRAYQSRLDEGGQGVDRETLYTLASQVAAVVTAPPVDRVDAGRAVGMLAYAMNEHLLAVELLDAAVGLMPSVVPRESGWEDQEHRLGKYRGLVTESVAAHCAIDDPAGAVEIAELGRGVLLGTQLDSRTDLSDLEQALPALGARLRRVRELLNAVHTTSGGSATEPLGRIDDRKQWWVEHDELLTRIREHSGFERFLLPPRLTDLQQAVTDGAVIVVNAGQRRSDAIVLTHNVEPMLVRLPDLASADVTSHAAALLEATYDNGLTAALRRQRVIPEILGWLWDTIVHPALRATLSLNAVGSSLPRVWWLPTGLLGLFPLHAASSPGQPGALDIAISSYIPTLRALAYAHTRPVATTRRQLTVALHHTRGLPDLPGTAEEATTLHTHHPDLPLLLDDAATTDRVLANLSEATWAHFACHAGIDFTAPSRSGLRLHDATLTLPEISRLQLTHAELAYLSACSTAHRGISHADESLHPASAFQLAGFRHVVASLWPLSDSIAATAATTFYQHLPPSPTADHAAIALHHTTRELRAQHPDRPDLWSALIHSGP